MSERLPRLKCEELVRVLKKLGFEERPQKGSHLHLFHPITKKRTTVPMHKGREIPIGTLKAILRDAELDTETLRKYL